MYERILVALDGSDLALRVLPYVEALARRLESGVTLLTATTPLGAIIAGSAVGAAPIADCPSPRAAQPTRQPPRSSGTCSRPASPRRRRATRRRVLEWTNHDWLAAQLADLGVEARVPTVGAVW